MTSASIVVFSGSSHTGKTTLAKRLAENLSWKFLSFGDFVRQEARRLGVDVPTRKELQNLGQKMVEEDAISFCRAALKSVGFTPGEPLVIDGLRHLQVLDALKTLSQRQSIKLVFLHAPIDVREARSIKRAQDNLWQIDSHRVESQINDLRKAADLVVDASGNLSRVFELIRAWVLETCGVPSPAD